MVRSVPLILTLIVAMLALTVTPLQAVSDIQSASWYVEYWNNMDLAGEQVYTESFVGPISFFWGSADGPHPSVHPDQFSARFTARPWLDAGYYRFELVHDDGVRLYLDDTLMLDRWRQASVEVNSTEVLEIAAGEHDIRLEYFEGWGSAVVSMIWLSTNQWAWPQVHAEMQGRPSPPDDSWITPIELQFTPLDDDYTRAWRMTTDSYGITPLGVILRSGDYRLWAKGAHTLATAQTLTVDVGIISVPTGLPLEGDANGDNTINITDFSILAAGFGKMQNERGRRV
ncbi:MAG: hypothetical protein IPK19_23990 [Chloroflexi bacterium]|nr:hypothetical protein [Chloroflexota bacterium]